ncbi:MAG: HEAT repeat domain-containing protein [Synechococcales cyanobacterium C42_A2020_086]|jgi:hypothetical protein|nr:HEAT repeat domain-containing protein [Synechococcales cyanobacterium C42_A2020_086]
MDHAYYCPACFAEISKEAFVCPACGVNIQQWEKEHASYAERLIHALKHPNPEARMGSIITLGNRKDVKAAIPLAECAFDHPIDVWQDMEIIRALRKLPNSPEKETALRMLLKHPGRVIREEAEASLVAEVRDENNSIG